MPNSICKPGIAWCLLAVTLMTGTLFASVMNPLSIDWQPGLALTEPWRWWTAGFVHYSTKHFLGNLLGTVLVAALGWVARIPWRTALAWFMAWPLTHLLLQIQPDLRHYGGLSGLLHAGVCIVAIHLLAVGYLRQKLIGGTILLVTLVKVLSESPFDGPVQRPADWDIAIATIAHATGWVAGVLCAIAAEVWQFRRGLHRVEGS